MQVRRTARELALLGMSQLPQKPEKLSEQDLDGLIMAAVRSLVGEVNETLESAAADLARGHERLLQSETRTTELEAARAMVHDAIAATQNAINNLGSALQLPELVQLANRDAVRSYAVEILSHVARHRDAIDAELNKVMVSWQVNRLALIDRDLLRLAIVELQYLNIPDRVAINEVVELAKRYSDEDGYRFINGVLRRWLNRGTARPPAEAAPDADPSASMNSDSSLV